MIITDIKSTPVRVDTTRTNAWAAGQGRSITRTVIEIFTDEGVTGLGEAPRGDTAPVIDNALRDQLIGLEVEEIREARSRCLPRVRDYGLIDDVRRRLAFGGVNLAMWDLVGKKRGLPVYKLLGGAVRETAPFVAYAYNVDLSEGHELADVPAIMAGVAKAMMVDTGAVMFEYKTARQPVEVEIEIAHAVREALGPDADIGLDANMHLNMRDARRLLGGIADVGICCFEEPVDNLQDMQRLHDEFGVMISSHCSRIELIRHYPGVEGVVADYHAEEGLDRCLNVAANCAAVGKQFWLHSYQECGVSWAGRVHFGMACPEAFRPAQALYYWIEDPLIENGNRWRIRDGGVAAPDLPGLGVELDRDAVARASEAFRTLGDAGYLDHRRGR